MRREACSLLLALATPDTPDRLLTLLEDREAPISAEVLEAFGALGGPEHWRILSPRVQAGDMEVRIAAARALGSLGAPESAGELRRVMETASGPLRLACGVSLADLGDPDAVPILIEFLRSPTHWRSALLALRREAGTTFGRDRARTPEDVEASVRRWAHWWQTVEKGEG
ncbi:MAG: HEAT repeat domain-containing protein [Planctomycetes bacterium]|nr:HEAT repeat domain-containing protein [Planctomycetota bacterium]